MTGSLGMIESKQSDSLKKIKNKKGFNLFGGESQRERVHRQGEGERESEKQTPGRVGSPGP